MTVTTRNQLKNNTKVTTPDTNLEPNNMFHWFVSVVKKGLKYVAKNNEKKRQIRKLITVAVKYNKNDITNIYENDIKIIYYNIIRRITELMYFIEQYLPEVIHLSSGMSKFAQSVYYKVQDMYMEIRSSVYYIETEDEKKAITALIYTLQDVEKMVINFLPTEFHFKHIIDNIQQECEYDYMTDNKIFKISVKATNYTKYVEPCQVWKTGNHTRFIYNVDCDE